MSCTTFEQSVQSLTKTFKHQGHGTGKLRNFAEVPLFLDSRASRLIQMADLIAYWIFRRYESGDDRGFELIRPFFRSQGAVAAGLYELISPASLLKLENCLPPKYPFPEANPIGELVHVLPGAVAG